MASAVPTEPRLVRFRQAAIERLVDAVGDRKVEVAAHPGRFTLGDLRKFEAIAPTVRVAVLGGDATDTGSNRPLVACGVAAMIVTEGADPVVRDDAGAALAERCAKALHNWTPGIDGVATLDVRTVELIRSEDEQQKTSASLWGVVAVAEVAIGEEGGLPDPGELEKSPTGFNILGQC